MSSGFKTLSSKEKENSKARGVKNDNLKTADDDADIEVDIDKDDEDATKEEEEKFEQLQLKILVFLYLEKFTEIVIVFLVTALAIFWKPMRNLVEIFFWPLLGLVLVASVLLTFCYYLNWFRQFPGFIIYKFFYIVFLLAVFLILAIHVPLIVHFLSPYFALVAAGSVAATYIFFALIIVTHKHLCRAHAHGYSPGVYGLCILAGILLVNQPIYLYTGNWTTIRYQDFMINIVFGLLVSLIFSYETLIIYRRFTESSKLEEFLNSKWLLPGLVTVYFARDKKLLFSV